MNNSLTFRKHAIQRMFQRQISIADVHAVLNEGKTIQSYPQDTPYPSRLVLGWCGHRPIHVVVAETPENQTIIITAYEPDPLLWEYCFERKKT